MKIEKINENQIRCTLNKEDLLDRQLRLSELAYGTEKAKLLFRDMMQQAAFEFGFEADDIPLMIEAIPVSPECLILVVTKVEDPDELDTRFSKFSADSSIDSDEDEDDASYADEIINCFGELDNLLDDDNDTDIVNKNEDKLDGSDFLLPESLSLVDNKKNEVTSANTSSTEEQKDLIKTYSFGSLQEVIQLSSIIVYNYHGSNTLYKNEATSTYYLVLSKSDHTPKEFNKICNIVLEYGKAERTSNATLAYYEEHFTVITKNTAVQILSVM